METSKTTFKVPQGELLKSDHLTLTKILERVTIIPITYKYNYNKLSCINSKPALQAGNIELLEYKLNLILHYSFCNPQKIIDLMLNFAKNREPVEWIYQGQYKGDFVIDEVENITTQSINGDILQAEINLNLLEVPIDEEYKEQEETNPDLSQYEQYSEYSNKLVEFKDKIKTSIKDNLKNAVSSTTLSDNLSSRAKEILLTATNSVLSDITSGNITEIYSKISSIKDGLDNAINIDYQDLINIQDAISTIPNKLNSSILRYGT